MADQTSVAHFRLSARCAQRTIRARAKDSSKIIWGTHARERMLERGIEDVDVLRILRRGWVDEDPEPAKEGEWKCKITHKIRGNRVAGVVTIIMLDDELFVKTVEWEDGL